MVQGDERYARLKHQSLFLHARGLMSPEMAELKRQLWLRERLAGKDPSKLDPHLADRFHDELEKAVVKQLTATGLFDEWLEAWEANETPSVVQESPAPSTAAITRSQSTAVEAEGSARIRDQKNRIERRVRALLAERVITLTREGGQS
jgi:hypothetical protein